MGKEPGWDAARRTWELCHPQPTACHFPAVLQLEIEGKATVPRNPTHQTALDKQHQPFASTNSKHPLALWSPKHPSPPWHRASVLWEFGSLTFVDRETQKKQFSLIFSTFGSLLITFSACCSSVSLVLLRRCELANNIGKM